MQDLTSRELDMAALGEDVLTKVSTTAAEDFADAYHTALQASRDKLTNFYVDKRTTEGSRPVPTIAWNGNSMQDADEFQDHFKDMPYTFFEIITLDCHVLNTDCRPQSMIGQSLDPKKTLMIAVTINGNVRLEEQRVGPMKTFSETLVLVPNFDKMIGKGPAMQKKTWLIQNQTFRYVA